MTPNDDFLNSETRLKFRVHSRGVYGWLRGNGPGFSLIVVSYTLSAIIPPMFLVYLTASGWTMGPLEAAASHSHTPLW